MRAILMSIHPKYCELIANGKKTVEVRKTKPKLETPFKVYIYCTKQKYYYRVNRFLCASDESLWLSNGKVKMCDGFEYWAGNAEYENLNCTVIGEFVCARVDEYRYGVYDGEFCYHIPTVEGEKTCIEYGEAQEYGNGKPLYFWHISDLVIYDKPKELSEFYNECEKPECDDCPYLHFENTPNSYEGWCECNEKIPITRPPQSWCYVEELQEERH